VVTGDGGRADYSRLTAALRVRTEPLVRMGWDELDAIVGGLPRSAVEHHPQWWHGDRPNTRAWRAAGYELAAVEIGTAVTFRRTGLADAAADSRRARPPAAHLAGSSVETLQGVDPRRALVVLTCSAAKTAGGRPAGTAEPQPWPPALREARSRVLTSASVDNTRLLPAWRRYAGTFYRHAEAALADACTVGNVVIISGGYGLVRADEPIGTYDKVFHLGDWPPGLLESLLVEQARDSGVTTVVGFAAHSTDYARLLRRTPWHGAGISALLVTVTGVHGGAMVEVPRRLGQAFTAFWHGRRDAYPAGTTVEALG
jgi:hypothetical protein